MSRRVFGKGGVESLQYTGGGTHQIRSGYILEYCPDHPHCNARGSVLQHRLVMERKLGQILPRSIVVHHLNGVKTDNRPDNLELISSHSEHMRQHQRQTAKRYNAETIARVRTLAADPLTGKMAACRELGMAPMTLAAILAENRIGWELPAPMGSEQILAALLGKSRKEACDVLGLSLQTLWNRYPEVMRKTANRKLRRWGAKRGEPVSDCRPSK